MAALFVQCKPALNSIKSLAKEVRRWGGQFRPDREGEADKLGAQYAWAAGYDPNYLVTFFERIAKQDKAETGSNTGNSHILTPERIAKLQKLIARFPMQEKNILNTPEFQAVKNRALETTSR